MTVDARGADPAAGTQYLGPIQGSTLEQAAEPRHVLERVFNLLVERGYNPLDQLVGYLLSGDPAYITSHGDARSLVRQVGRDELLEELVKSYLSEGQH